MLLDNTFTGIFDETMEFLEDNPFTRIIDEMTIYFPKNKIFLKKSLNISHMYLKVYFLAILSC